MSRHTPGPWMLNKTDEVIQTPASADGAFRGTVVCDFERAHVYGDDSDEWQANASLIAAAPELLEAAKIMHAMLVERGFGGLAGTMLGDIAIRKAETKR